MNPAYESHLRLLEEAINPAEEERLQREWLDFAYGRFLGELFIPRREALNTPIAWPRVTVNEALDSLDAMMLQQYGGCAAQLNAGGGGVLCVRANYGSSILPSVFGARMFIMDDALDTLPTSYPLGEEGVDALLEQGPPAQWGGLWPKVMAAGERFASILARFPRLRQFTHVYHPDLQGPIDACEVLWGSGLMTAFYDTPDKAHALLRLVTDAYKRLLREWQGLFPAREEWATHWGLLHRGVIMLRDDSAMNLSPTLFDEFVRPYDQELLDECGGGCVHFCGRGDHYIGSLSEARGLHGVNLSQPECNDMEVIYRNTVDKGIPLFGLTKSSADTALKAGRLLHGRAQCF